MHNVQWCKPSTGTVNWLIKIFFLTKLCKISSDQKNFPQYSAGSYMSTRVWNVVLACTSTAAAYATSAPSYGTWRALNVLSWSGSNCSRFFAHEYMALSPSQLLISASYSMATVTWHARIPHSNSAVLDWGATKQITAMMFYSLVTQFLEASSQIPQLESLRKLITLGPVSVPREATRHFNIGNFVHFLGPWWLHAVRLPGAVSRW